MKLSNTFPVDVKAGELPSEEMYMAGKSLFPLTTTMAAMMAKEFGGKLRLSYAGGADAFNIDKLFACGIWPITMATTELKPGGYQRFTQIGDKLDALDFKPFTGVDVTGHGGLSLAARSDKYHCEGHQAHAPPQALGEGSPAGLLHRPLQGRLPHRPGHPGVYRAVPQGRVRRRPGAHHRRRTPCPSSPAPSAPTTA